MNVFKISMVLWITFFILAKSSDNEEDGWSDDEVDVIPICLPNFFKPVSEPCVCVGSEKTIEGVEVGKLYCFPQPNKFQVQIENHKYQKISIPKQYEDNMVPNQELKSCTPDEQVGVNEVCFCGTENDKENLRNTELSNFVPLKHICVPLNENEETNRLLPYHKLRYCYQNRCQRNSADYKDNLSMQKLDDSNYLCENWKKRLNESVKLKNKEQVYQILTEEEESEYTIEWLMKENIDQPNTALHIALENGDEEIVQMLLNVFVEDENENLIEFLMKENQEKETTLHLASRKGNAKNVELLLNAFGKEKNKELTKNLMKQNRFNKDTIERLNIKVLLNAFGENQNNKLMEYVMKENQEKKTALHLVSQKKNKEILELLLNVFGEEQKESLIEYVMKEDFDKNTALQIALGNEDDEIARLLLNSNIFSKYQNVKLVQYMLQKNTKNCSVLDTVKENLVSHKAKKEKYELRRDRHYGHHFLQNLNGEELNHLNNFNMQFFNLNDPELERLATKIKSCEQMGIFLDHKFENANTLNDLQQVIKLFNGQTSDQKNDSSPILNILHTENLAGSIILKFLIVDFDPNMHYLEQAKTSIMAKPKHLELETSPIIEEKHTNYCLIL